MDIVDFQLFTGSPAVVPSTPGDSVSTVSPHVVLYSRLFRTRLLFLSFVLAGLNVSVKQNDRAL